MNTKPIFAAKVRQLTYCEIYSSWSFDLILTPQLSIYPHSPQTYPQHMGQTIVCPNIWWCAVMSLITVYIN